MEPLRRRSASSSFLSLVFIGVIAVGTLVTVRLLSEQLNTRGEAAVRSLGVYRDSLQSGWENWSWKAGIDLRSRDFAHEGRRAIAFTPQSYGALALKSSVPIDIGKYPFLHFAIRGGQEGQRFSLIFFDTNNKVIKSSISLATIGGDPEVGAWKTYVVPFEDLGITVPFISGFAIQDVTGTPQETVYVDEVEFLEQDLSNK